jgi:HEAT repeat protein
MNLQGDRSRTFALLELIAAAGTPSAERASAFRELKRLEDHRSIAPLTALVADDRLPDTVRSMASDVVAGFDDTTTSAMRRAWWASADPLLMRHALGLMEREDADIVVPVAIDDAHPLQATALDALGIGFGEPEFPPVLIRALGHPTPNVRAVAANALLWDEPVAAESGLLDAAHDHSPEVAVAAINTLRYYATRRVLRALAELRGHDDEQVSAAAADSFADLQGTFENAAEWGDAGPVALLREWMAPVGDLVKWPDDISPPERWQPSTPPRRRPLPERELLALLDDPDLGGSVTREALLQNDWDAYDSAARTRLTARLISHADPIVRECAGWAMAVWAKADELLELIGDRSSSVRKTAMYNLSLIPANPAIAERAWQYLATVTSTSAQEALRTYLVHAPAPEATDRLVESVRSDPREAIRYESLHGLTNLNATKEIRALTPLLDDPPGLTWAAHTALLDGLHELGLPAPPLTHLAAIDNLDLMQTIVQLKAPKR